MQDYSISLWVCIIGKVNIRTLYSDVTWIWVDFTRSWLQVLVYSVQCSAIQGFTLFLLHPSNASVCVCFYKSTMHYSSRTFLLLLLNTNFKDKVYPGNICEMCQILQWNHVFEIILLYSECIHFLSDIFDRPWFIDWHWQSRNRHRSTSKYFFDAVEDTAVLQDMVVRVTCISVSEKCMKNAL